MKLDDSNDDFDGCSSLHLGRPTSGGQALGDDLISIDDFILDESDPRHDHRLFGIDNEKRPSLVQPMTWGPRGVSSQSSRPYDLGFGFDLGLGDDNISTRTPRYCRDTTVDQSLPLQGSAGSRRASKRTHNVDGGDDILSSSLRQTIQTSSGTSSSRNHPYSGLWKGSESRHDPSLSPRIPQIREPQEFDVDEINARLESLQSLSDDPPWYPNRPREEFCDDTNDNTGFCRPSLRGGANNHAPDSAARTDENDGIESGWYEVTAKDLAGSSNASIDASTSCSSSASTDSSSGSSTVTKDNTLTSVQTYNNQEQQKPEEEPQGDKSGPHSSINSTDTQLSGSTFHTCHIFNVYTGFAGPNGSIHRFIGEPYPHPRVPQPPKASSSDDYDDHDYDSLSNSSSDDMLHHPPVSIYRPISRYPPPFPWPYPLRPLRQTSYGVPTSGAYFHDPSIARLRAVTREALSRPMPILGTTTAQAPSPKSMPMTAGMNDIPSAAEVSHTENFTFTEHPNGTVTWECRIPLFQSRSPYQSTFRPLHSGPNAGPLGQDIPNSGEPQGEVVRDSTGEWTIHRGRFHPFYPSLNPTSPIEARARRIWQKNHSLLVHHFQRMTLNSTEDPERRRIEMEMEREIERQRRNMLARREREERDWMSEMQRRIQQGVRYVGRVSERGRSRTVMGSPFGSRQRRRASDELDGYGSVSRE